MLAKRFNMLFEGSGAAMGFTKISQRRLPSGKLDSRSWTEYRQATEKEWKSHLSGELGIGLPPLHKDKGVKWGCIDIDKYEGSDTQAHILDMIKVFKLPLVPVQTKSGGLHLFLFLSDWSPASKLIETLTTMAALVGQAGSEIFPKQVEIKGEGDVGNWVNMPYFGDSRKALTLEGKELPAEEFLDLAERSKVDLEQGVSLINPSVEVIPDGPPCLNLIYAGDKHEGHRNTVLSNTAVYLKKKYPQTWQTELEKFNRKFSEPLPSREVEAVKKSYAAKNYKYQCGKEPLCMYCDSLTCKAREYGITDSLPIREHSLSMIKTDPPLWYVDIDTGEGPKRIELKTQELLEQRCLQKKIMESLQVVMPLRKREEWEEVLSNMMKNVSVIPVPEGFSRKDQLTEAVIDFLLMGEASQKPEDVLRGIPYLDKHEAIFRLHDLMSYLKRVDFNLARNEVIAYLRQHLSADKYSMRIKTRVLNLWRVPLKEELVNPYIPTTKNTLD